MAAVQLAGKGQDGRSQDDRFKIHGRGNRQLLCRKSRKVSLFF